MTIELSLGNAKTGPSISLPNGTTCPGATDICKAGKCYVNYGRMALPVCKDKRERNWQACKEGMKQGDLAYQIINAVKAAKISTLRIHDSGDFAGPLHVNHWVVACEMLPKVSFWAYTRSWAIPTILAALVNLAKLPNVALWLSCDVTSYKDCIQVIKDNPNTFAGLAFMQTSNDQQMIIKQLKQAANLIVFLEHQSFGRLAVKPISAAPNCPAIMHEIEASKKSPACLACKRCLPVQVS